MSKRRLLVTGGIISLIDGVLELGLASYYLYIIIDTLMYYDWEFPNEDFILFIFILMTPFLIITGIMGLLGGYFALKKRRKILAIIGSLITVVPFAIYLLTRLSFISSVISHARLENDNGWIYFLILFVLLPVVGIIPPILLYLSRNQFEHDNILHIHIDDTQ